MRFCHDKWLSVVVERCLRVLKRSWNWFGHGPWLSHLSLWQLRPRSAQLLQQATGVGRLRTLKTPPVDPKLQIDKIKRGILRLLCLLCWSCKFLTFRLWGTKDRSQDAPLRLRRRRSFQCYLSFLLWITITEFKFIYWQASSTNSWLLTDPVSH